MTIKGVAYDDKKAAGERLLLACAGDCPMLSMMLLGTYRGFELNHCGSTALSNEHQAVLQGRVELPGIAGR